MVGDPWRKMPLGDFVTLQRGFDLPVQDRKPGTVPVISSSGVSGNHSEATVLGPGVVTGRYGTIGQVFFTREDFWPLNTTLWVKDFHGNDPLFASYLLRTVDYRSCSDKSSVPGINRNDLHRLPVRVPPLTEQKAIAHILGTLDDQIELNRRMCRTLEGIARAIFKSWFVDFDPVRAKAERHDPGLPKPIADLFPDCFEDSELGKIPKGWDVRGLDRIARFLNGLALQKYPPQEGRWLPVIKIAQLRAGDTRGADRASVDIDPHYVVDDGNVLFSWSGSLECVLWAAGKGALNQHLFKVTSTEFPRWFYYLWIHEHLPSFRHIAAGKATTMGHIQRHHLSEAYVIVPDRRVLGAADKVVAPTIGQVTERRVECCTLAALRDALLPKLISGELPVKHAKRIIRRHT